MAACRRGMPKEIALRHRLPQFLHLFSSDAYSTGYYSYLWFDVMAADTWQALIETGATRRFSKSADPHETLNAEL